MTITVTDAAAGSEVSLSVAHEQGQVSTFETSKTVNDDGTAVFQLHPDGKAVLGAYSVVASGEGFDDLTGEFTVVTNGTEVERDDEDDSQGGADDSDDNGSDDNGSEGGGSGDQGGSGDGSRSGSAADLPRTGTELTGLALGAGLLVVGAAAVVVTRRRSAQADPSGVLTPWQASGSRGSAQDPLWI